MSNIMSFNPSRDRVLNIYVPLFIIKSKVTLAIKLESIYNITRLNFCTIVFFNTNNLTIKIIKQSLGIF